VDYRGRSRGIGSIAGGSAGLCSKPPPREDCL